ncbi:MAG: glycoside hydrolase family 15 protein [Thermodesulfobacteriota bacterium]
MYKKISDYGIIGNLQTIALVALDGSIDWLCFPHIDSPSVFGALLDAGKGGSFCLKPAEPFDSAAEYLHDTNILKTSFRTESGVMILTDFMAISFTGKENLRDDRQALYRLIEIEEGEVEVNLTFAPRFDYARIKPDFEAIEGGVVAGSEHTALVLTASLPLKIDKEQVTGNWKLSEGEKVWFKLGTFEGIKQCSMEDRSCVSTIEGEEHLEETRAFWRSWVRKSETGRTHALGEYQSMINRSALTLKLLYYDPTGTIAAAATTSLPEEIGGERNWDYRYTWIRDTSFTLQALFNLGHLSETEGYLRWVERILSEDGVDKLMILYGLRGERELPEQTLDHLEGYKGSRPVRIGNEAATQVQLDIYGEIMDAALKLSDYVGKIDDSIWPMLRNICNFVADHWQERDNGIWEVRDGPFHFVYSKVMCWVALDRGLIIAKRYGFDADKTKWQEAMESIRQEVLERGYNNAKESFVQHYETDALDASNLLIPYYGFLPYDDKRIISTIKAAERELSQDSFLYRYKSADGLSGHEGTFLLCTFWFIDCLSKLGRIEEAEHLLKKMEQASNHLGLFAEEYDVRWQEMLGNFPQAFTHIGYINSVWTLLQQKRKKEAEEKGLSQEPPGGGFITRLLLTKKIVLNDGENPEDSEATQVAAGLKETMNIMRGAFFDRERGRVAYEDMKYSEIYSKYINLSYQLKNFRLDSLLSLKEKTAFWINLYNVLVIHGVIELGIRDSVNEVRGFFRRIRYIIDGLEFTPDDIEHGILRCNRKPPNSLFRVFGNNDERSKNSLEELDPRIHFALVCASSSCPPIDIYTHERLDEELDLSARTFINGGGAILDREHNRISLSKIFDWYRKDFGSSDEEMIRLIIPYFYNEEEREYILQHVYDIRIEYQKYDWRLNR